MKMSRREMLCTGGLAMAGSLLASACRAQVPATSAAAPRRFEIMRSDAEWHERLTPVQYAVLRREGTERPYSSPLNSEHRKGTFACEGCALPVFSSDTKFESRTGWPSFWAPLPGAVGEQRDSTLGIVRAEIHCRRCGGHLGHVFDEGTRPTGKRYCMNGVAMAFAAA